jgi:hypothetical protein
MIVIVEIKIPCLMCNLLNIFICFVIARSPDFRDDVAIYSPVFPVIVYTFNPPITQTKCLDNMKVIPSTVMI